MVSAVASGREDVLRLTLAVSPDSSSAVPLKPRAEQHGRRAPASEHTGPARAKIRPLASSRAWTAPVRYKGIGVDQLGDRQ
jgi:hypothetical protein